MKNKILLLPIFVLLSIAICFGQEKEENSDPKYKLLATTRTSTMQKELDQASALGYRIVASAPTSGSELVVFLSLDGTSEKPYKYKLLATTRTSTMQKELAEFAEQGYRLKPSTAIPKKRTFGSTEIVVIMELDPNSKIFYEYKLLATSRTSTLQKEMIEAEEAGFRIVGMLSRGEHMVVVERERKY